MTLVYEPAAGSGPEASDAEVAAAVAAEATARDAAIAAEATAQLTRAEVETNKDLTSTTNTFPTRIETKVITWSQGSPTATEDRTLQYFTRAATITAVRGVIVGSTSITIVIKKGADRSAAGTDVVASVTVSSTTTGAALTIANAAISAGDYLWIESSALSGTPDEASVTIEYTGG